MPSTKPQRVWVCALACASLITSLSGIEEDRAKDEGPRVEVDEVHYVSISEPEPWAQFLGTRVVLSVVQPDFHPNGILKKECELSFVDDKGRDLFEQGRLQREKYKKDKEQQIEALKKWRLEKHQYEGAEYEARKPKVMVVSQRSQPNENSISLHKENILGQRDLPPAEVRVRCHALALPTKGAKALNIKGRLVLKGFAAEKHTVIVPADDLTKDAMVELEKETLKIGASRVSKHGDKITEVIWFKTPARVHAVSVLGREDEKDLVRLPYTRGREPDSIQVWRAQLKPDDKIAIEYFLPGKAEVDVDLSFSPSLQSE